MSNKSEQLCVSVFGTFLFINTETITEYRAGQWRYKKRQNTALYLEAFLRQTGNQIIAGILEFSEVAWKAKAWFCAMRQSLGILPYSTGSSQLRRSMFILVRKRNVVWKIK